MNEHKGHELNIEFPATVVARCIPHSETNLLKIVQTELTDADLWEVPTIFCVDCDSIVDTDEIGLTENAEFYFAS